jgi:hypothetical protein
MGSEEEFDAASSRGAAPREMKSPVRGNLTLDVSTSSGQTLAGSDVSIFVVVRNPFEVPVTLYQVRTHIPVELIDVNKRRLDESREWGDRPFWEVLASRFLRRRRDYYSGIATAVGIDVAPEEATELMRADVQVRGNVVEGTVAGVLLSFPENPSTEELDAIFRRFADYKRGVIPETLQPGDSVVRQFVLRTRQWLLFTPLAHTFQIQATYSLDGCDHTTIAPYELQIQARTSAIALGGLSGAVLGTSLKVLTSSGQSASAIVTAFAVAALATIAVVIAFARKALAQPLVSVEDFWGGALIGFSVGFFGFHQFTKLLPGGS